MPSRRMVSIPHASAFSRCTQDAGFPIRHESERNKEMKEKIDIEETRKDAESILADMNDLVRGRDFAKMVMDARFEKLRCKIVSLGWLPLCKSLRVKIIAGKRELRVQMKLVDPDSAEAKKYDCA